MTVPPLNWVEIAPGTFEAQAPDGLYSVVPYIGDYGPGAALDLKREDCISIRIAVYTLSGNTVERRVELAKEYAERHSYAAQERMFA